MSFVSEFQYLWKQTEDGVYAALLRQVESGQAVTAADANQAFRSEAARWMDAMRPQHSFLLKLGKTQPAMEKEFIDRMNVFTFQAERGPGAPSAAPYMLANVVLAALGAVLGYLVSGFSLAAKYLGTAASVIGGGVIFAALFAGVLRGMWKSKAESGQKSSLDGYMRQMEKLESGLADLCARADRR